MKLLLLGGNGQVGRELRRSLAPLGEVVVATRDGAHAEVTANFDAPDTLTTLVRRVAPDVVINAAAYTAVDKAEAEPDAAFRVNALAPAALAQGCVAVGAQLLHYSTDYVFAGNGQRPCREDDDTAPLGVYGASKLEGEALIRASGAQYAILRTAWVYAAHSQNFLRTMLRLAGERDILRVVADQIGTPTPAHLIADVTAAIVRQGLPRSGIWHLTTTGQTSWHGFAEAIMAEALTQGVIARAPRVEAITTADYPTPARRPAYSVLDTHKLQRDFGIALPSWQAGLQQVLQTMVAESLP